MKRVKTNNQFKDTMLLNSNTYVDYLNRMKKICVSLFEWINLPDSMNQRFLELTLYYLGTAAFLYDKEYTYINTKAVSNGYINMYGLPTKLNCFSFRYNEVRDTYMGPDESKKKDEEAILVMNNYDCIPTCATIELFAYRLAIAQRTMDTNINAQKTPVMILTDDKQRLTMRNVYEQYEGNTPFIYGDRNGLASESIKALKTDAPYIVDKLTEYKREIWNEFLTTIGVSNLLNDKRERLVNAEANINNEVINLNLESFLIPRKEACRQFNEKFGTNIDVKVRSDLHNIIKETESVNGSTITETILNETEGING